MGKFSNVVLAHQKQIFFFFAAVTKLAQAEKCTICVPGGGGYFIVACKLQYLGHVLNPRVKLNLHFVIFGAHDPVPAGVMELLFFVTDCFNWLWPFHN